jgi:ATP-dependent Zn protease
LLNTDTLLRASVESDLQALNERARILVRSHRPAVEEVSRALLSEERLAPERIRTIIDYAELQHDPDDRGRA